MKVNATTTAFVMVSALLGLVLPTQAQELRDKSIAKDVEAIIQSAPEFLEGDMCRVARIGDDIIVLSSAYGITTEDGFSAKKDARRVAQVTADRQMVELLHGSMVSSRTWMEQTEITVNDQSTFKSFFSDKTESDVEGLIQGAETLGSWWLAEGDERVFFVLRGIRFPTEALDAGPEKADPGRARPTDPAAGPKVVVVEATGFSDYLGNKDFSRDQAARDAVRAAIEQALGMLMSSETVAENGELVRDKILSNTEGMIKGYEVLGEGVQDDESYFVRIRAQVVQGEVERSARAVGLLMSKMGKPKVAIIPLETLNGARLIYDSSPITSALSNIFRADPYNIVTIDMYQSMVSKRQQQPELWETYQALLDPSQPMDVIKFGELGITADIIVKGEVFLEDKGKDTDGLFDVYEGTAVLKILWAGTGGILGTVMENTRAIGESPEAAMTTVVKKLTPRIQPLVEEMIRRFQDIANNGQTIAVDMTGVPSGRKGRKLTRLVEDGLSASAGVKQCEILMQADDRRNFSVVFKGTASEFRSLLENFLDDEVGEVGDWRNENGYDFDLDMKGASLVVEWAKSE